MSRIKGRASRILQKELSYFGSIVDEVCGFKLSKACMVWYCTSVNVNFYQSLHGHLPFLAFDLSRNVYLGKNGEKSLCTAQF